MPLQAIKFKYRMWLNLTDTDPSFTEIPDLQRPGVCTGWLVHTYRMECDWKVFVDNYLDGGYHVPHLPPATSDGAPRLCRISDRTG